MGIFIPKRLREWQPEHMRMTPMRRCHWCTSGPHRLDVLVHVLEGPMRWHFCSDDCSYSWQQQRHEGDILEWLKCPAGERAHVLKEGEDATDSSKAACRRAFAGLCSESRLALSVPEDA